MYLEWIDVLKSAALFRGIGGESLNLMLDCLRPAVRRFKPRDIITARGEVFQGIGIIASGKVALTRETFSGDRVILGILNAGDIFGERLAFSERKLWPVTTVAQEDCVVLFLPPHKVTGTCSNVCASHAALIMNLLRVLSDHVSMLESKIEHVSAKTVRGKVSSYLVERYRESGASGFTLPMKRNELADYLNLPRPSLSREMGLMRDAGIIEFDGARVNVLDVLKLEEGTP